MSSGTLPRPADGVAVRERAQDSAAADARRGPRADARRSARPVRVTRVLIDTSVLIGAEAPGDLEGAISAASLAELHFGALVASDPDERARRAQRLGAIEATFDPLPIDAAVAREGVASPLPWRNVADGHGDERSISRSRPPPTLTRFHSSRPTWPTSRSSTTWSRFRPRPTEARRRHRQRASTATAPASDQDDESGVSLGDDKSVVRLARGRASGVCGDAG